MLTERPKIGSIIEIYDDYHIILDYKHSITWNIEYVEVFSIKENKKRTLFAHLVMRLESF